mmetsp:Transcript_29718/g.28577  ORF Transcript_29718/g.28577 Transcript_29718/m.28577 type:complete len:106 (-) Transcript_29718:164-481(-)|eukprot:CAMPEP_0197834404 /NCGR_PEP_ID=MMETSP1437-20131217/22240_1 /TAXON_ID=49252 ORGANISM="Eucampia antarctica, Strain CCMP1452" /NCGR_SAMPLE_ID=MMETSP1437 /ASSEMBLY_ACC=CAM_ASM_001096 /LENGTH=105 /DNA_ID=CAMNT_0043439047 /DNA_START=71 /DNA_END=388 /DNA_ORIENTATION=+
MKILAVTFSTFFLFISTNSDTFVSAKGLRDAGENRELVGDDDLYDSEEWEEMWDEGGGEQEFEDEDGDRKLEGDDDLYDSEEWEEMWDEGGGEQEFEDEEENNED